MTEPPNSTFEWLEHPLVHAPFTICMAGVLFWMVILWAFNREHWIKEGKKALHELKDEFWVMFAAVCLVVIWDSQALYLYDLIAERVYGKPVNTPSEISPQMYLTIGPAIERVYALGKWAYQKATKKEN